MTARILLVGHGNRGGQWGRIISARLDAVLCGVVEPDRSAAARCREAHPEIAIHATLDDALTARGNIDLAVLATPPELHHEQARKIFAAGIPLLAEKPLACAREEAESIVAIADAAGLKLAVGLNFRYLPVSLKIRELIAGGALGAPGFAQFTYQRNRDGYRPGLNRYPLTMKHPMLLEQSIHHLDLIRFCLGREVEEISCRSWNPPWSLYAHDSNVHCELTLNGGVEVDYLGTWTGGWNELQFLFRVDCAEGVILQRALAGDLSVARTADPAAVPVALAACEPFRDDTDALLGAVLAALRDGGAMPCDGHDHLRTLAVCWAAIESAETGRRVRV